MGPSTADVFADQLRQGVGALEQRRVDLSEEWARFRSLSGPKRRRRTLASYWCRSHNCSLAVIWDSPIGKLMHLPRYHLSSELNEATSTEGGRARNTSNGEDDWKDQNFSLDDLAQGNTALNAAMGVVALNCPHVLQRFIPRAELLEDVAERRVRKF